MNDRTPWRNAPRGILRTADARRNGRDHRFERLVGRLHASGPRPVAELLEALASDRDERDHIVDLLERFTAIDPAIYRAVGADTFPPAPLHVVSEIGKAA